MTTTNPNPVSDADLLGRYASSGSPDAFAAIVDRYLPLIYSAALRQTRDRHLAEDVSQAALIIFSQKASGIDPSILPGWLMKTTHYAARNAIRQRARRIAHEQRAAAMKTEFHTPADPDAVARVIDPALARLRDADRTAVVLRYFQNKSFAEIAAHLQTTEAAAQRRIARAVEKLRGILSRQGVQISPAAFPAALAAQALHPVPTSLAVHATSLIGSKAASTSLIAKGALHAMTAAKIKATVAIAAAVLVVGTAVPTAYHYATARPEPIVAGPPPQVRAALASVTPKPPQPAGTDLSRPIKGSLPPGMAVEPLAIMNNVDKRWIRPTGDELTTLPAEAQQLLTNLSHMSIPGATHVLLFRITVPDLSSVSWSYSVEGTSMYGSTGKYDPKVHTHYTLLVFAPSRGADAITLTVNAADGPWTNSIVVPASATTPTKGLIHGATFTIDPPTEQANRARIKVPNARPLDGMDTDFYAVDSAGQKKYNNGMTGDRQGNSLIFPGPLSSYKEFRMDSRPFSYHATYAPVPLAFSK